MTSLAGIFQSVESSEAPGGLVLREELVEVGLEGCTSFFRIIVRDFYMEVYGHDWEKAWNALVLLGDRAVSGKLVIKIHEQDPDTWETQADYVVAVYPRSHGDPWIEVVQGDPGHFAELFEIGKSLDRKH